MWTLLIAGGVYAFSGWSNTIRYEELLDSRG